MSGGSGTLTVRSVRDSEEIVDAALAYFGEDGSWAVSQRSDRSATFTYVIRPSIGIAVLLFLLGLVPGIIYLLADRGTLTVTVTSQRSRMGDSETYVSWSDRDNCYEACSDFVTMIMDQEPSAGQEIHDASVSSPHLQRRTSRRKPRRDMLN